MSPVLSPGLTDRSGLRAFRHQRENLRFQKNSTGTCGLDQLLTLILTRLTFPLTGVAGGHLVLVHSVIWDVILWTRHSGSCPLISLRKWNAARPPCGKDFLKKQII